MAGKGTYAAYKQVRGVGNVVGDALAQTERAGFHYRREERQRNLDKQKRLEKAAEAYGVAKEMLQYDKTGVQALDKPNYKYFQNATKELEELTERIMADENDVDAVLRRKSILNSAKYMQTFAATYRDYMKDYSEGLANGTYSKTLNKGIPQKINEAFHQGKWSMFNDKNGDLQIMVDLDGNGEMDEEFAGINVMEFIQGNDLYKPKRAYHESDLRNDLLGSFGTFKQELSQDGSYWETKFEGFNPEHEDDLVEMVDQRLGATKADITEEGMSILGDEYGVTDLDALTEEQFQEVKTKIATNTINAVDTTNNRTYDRAGNQADQRLSISRDQNRRAEGRYQEETASESEGVELRVDGEGEPIMNDTYSDGYEFSFGKNKGVEAGNKTYTKAVLRDDKVILQGYETYTATKTVNDKEVEYKATRPTQELTNQSSIDALMRTKKKPGAGRNYSSLFDFAETLREKVRIQTGQGDIDSLESLD